MGGVVLALVVSLSWAMGYLLGSYLTNRSWDKFVRELFSGKKR